MATTKNVSVGSSWQAVANVAAAATASQEAILSDAHVPHVEYAVTAGAAPAADFYGHSISGEPERVTIAPGETLFIRRLNEIGSRPVVITTNATIV